MGEGSPAYFAGEVIFPGKRATDQAVPKRAARSADLLRGGRDVQPHRLATQVQPDRWQISRVVR